MTKVKHRFCYDCDADITHLARNAQRCELCSKWRKLEYNRWYMRKLRYLKKNQLGTTDFSEHRKDDFKQELADIEDEMIRLGIKLK